MKRCPTCQRTFDDAMRFCQADGTPLVEDAPVDPYKTIVARPEDIGAVVPKKGESAGEEGDLLEIPKEDSKRTMYASEEEIRKEMAAAEKEEAEVIEIPPLSESRAPEPPKFSEPSTSRPPFGDIPPPASPFSAGGSASGRSDDEGPKTMPPIPSPFSEPKREERDTAPAPPAFAEPEPIREASSRNPFDNPPPASAPMAQAEWTPPAPSRDPEPAGTFNAPGTPPAGEGNNKTLAIISLVTGILSILCCGWFVPAIAAIVMGFIAKSKADNNPHEYGGRGLALGGIITGIVSIVLGIIVVILYLFTGVLSGIANF